MALTCVCVPRGSPSCLLPLQEALKYQQVDLTQSPFKLLPPHLVLKHVRFFMRCIRTESLFPTALQLFHTQAPLAFHVRHSRGSSSWCRTPRLKSLMWGLDPSLLWETLCNYDYPPVCWLWILTIPCLHPSYPSHRGSFFIYFVMEYHLWLVFRSFSSIDSL